TVSASAHATVPASRRVPVRRGEGVARARGQRGRRYESHRLIGRAAPGGLDPLRREKKRENAMRVVVVGLGYVGSVCSACLASRGHHVVGVDTSAFKVECIEGGRSPIVEHQLESMIATARAE